MLRCTFPASDSNRALIVVDGDLSSPAVRAGAGRLRAQLARDRDIGHSTVQVNDRKDLALIAAPVVRDETDRRALDAVDRIRHVYAPGAFDGTGARVLVTGSAADGVGSTARLITGAALIIVAVFSGFATGELVMLQQMGFGIAVSLLIAATLIRSVVVPASMELLGRWNWYLPSWLGWIPELHVESS